MNQDPVLAELSALHSVLKSIDTSLAHLATAARLPYLYPADKAAELAVTYYKLREADAASFDAMRAAMPADDLNYEARVKTYGAEEAKRQFEPHAKAREARAAAMKAESAFQREHPLIAQLVTGRRE